MPEPSDNQSWSAFLGELGIDPTPPAAADAGYAASDEPATVAEKSPTALQLDAWGMRRGKELIDEGAIPSLDSSEDSISEDSISQAADFYAAAFEPTPLLAEACEDKLRQRFMELLLDAPRYRELHSSTQLDDLSSQIAAEHFARRFLAYRDECKSTPGGSEGDADADEGEGMRQQMQALQAAGEAAAQAQANVDSAQDAMRAFVTGGEGCGRMSGDQLRGMLKRIRDNDLLKQVIAMAGRYRRMAQAMQRAKTVHGNDEVFGVEWSGDLKRVLPRELARLSDPDLELDTLRRLAERKLLSRQRRGTERQAQGPVVIVVDESGSMSGNPIVQAKAFALAMAYIARTQHRYCCLVAFAGDMQGRFLPLPPGKWNELQLADWVGSFYGGGTDAHVPFVELPRKWEQLGCPAGKTDMIVVTDAKITFKSGQPEGFLQWKEAANCHLLSIVLDHDNGSTDIGTLGHLSDRWWAMPSMDVESDAVKSAMSI